MSGQKKSNKISEHFSKKDFVCKCGECEESIRISLGLIGALELLRSKARVRINIVKGYVCPECAEKEGRIKKNYHTLGLAADIQSNNISLKDLFLITEKISDFNGIGINILKKHLHVDTRKEKERKIWVVEADSEIDLTEGNRNYYLEKII